MAKIRSLRANVTREEAIEQFSCPGLLRPVRRALSGPLRSVADFYIPFRVFHLDVRNRGKLETRIMAIDSTTGTLTPYSFPQHPGEEELVSAETRNHAASLISQEAAAQIAITRAQRLLFSTGFFRVRELNISAKLGAEIHVPYWVGFRGSTERAKFTVMDAVRRRIEGAKVRQIIRNWLSAEG